MGVGADPDHRSPLLVHADEHRDSGIVFYRLGLPGGDGLNQIVGGFVLGVPAEEKVAPQVIGGHVLQGVFRRNPDEKELARLLLQGHVLQKGQQGGFLRVPRGFRLLGLFRRGLRGLRRGNVRLLRRRGHRLPAAAGEEEHEEQGGKQPSFHCSASASASHTAACASLGIRQSPRGDRDTVPIFGPSGRQFRLNCWVKKRR